MNSEIVYVDVQDLRVGMLLAENIYDLEGNILLASGIRLRDSYIRKIEETPMVRIAVMLQPGEQPEKRETQEQDQPLSAIQQKQQRLEATRSEAKSAMDKVLKQLQSQEFNSLDTILEIVERILNDILGSDDIVFHIDQLRDIDDYTFDHGINVAILSIVMGVVSGMNRQNLKELATGAILHDVGKLFLDQDLLNKPGALTGEEFGLVKHHSRLGYEVMRKFPELSAEAALISLNHHERLDGSGYPAGLSGDAIDLNSQIVGMVDVFDALTADKVYAKKVSPYKAVQTLIKLAGTHFNPELVKRFVSAIGYYYHGSVVCLQNDSYGVVIERDRYRPVVRIVQDAHGSLVTDHFEIDLKKNPTMRIKRMLTEAEAQSLAYYARRSAGIS